MPGLGAPDFWSWRPRRTQYAIRDGMLVPGGGETGRYDALKRRELPSAIATLQAGDEKAVLRFARLYGKLGYDLSSHTGEPLAWIWAHAFLLRWCLRVTGLLAEGSEKDIADTSAWLLSRKPPPEEERTLATIEAYSARYDPQIEAYNQAIVPLDEVQYLGPARPASALLTLPYGPYACREPVDGARAHVRMAREWILNASMGHIHRLFLDRDPEPPWSVYVLDRLVGYAYWHLANALEDRKATMRRCATCDRWFFPTDARQRFCPPGPGQQGSRCAARKRMRAARQHAARGSRPA